MSVFQFIFFLAIVALVPLASAFSAREMISYSRHPNMAGTPRICRNTRLCLSAEDEAKQLLERVRKLREEAAAMSGKTLDEVQEEARQKKRMVGERQRQLDEKQKDRTNSARNNPSSRVVPVPDDASAQIQQAASAVERAFNDGIVRQTVRLALLEDEEMMSGEVNEWPGGMKQMYREAARPLTEALLTEIRAFPTKSKIEEEVIQSNSPPNVTTETIWDFDGSAIVSAQAASGTSGDVTALVFPNTDTKYLKDIESLNKSVGPDRLLLLVNPFWQDVESWGFNILAPNGKKRAQEVIFNNGYDVTYAVLRFSVRGEDCVAVKAHPFDWQMYAYREDPSWYNKESPIWLGSSKDQPKSALFTEKINSRPEFKLSKNMRQMQRMMGNDDQ